jgi:hypothetical protein
LEWGVNGKQVSLSTERQAEPFVANAWQTYLVFLGILLIQGVLNVSIISSSHEARMTTKN